MDFKVRIFALLLLCFHATWGAEVVFGHEDVDQNLLKEKNWDFEEEISSDNWAVKSAKNEILTSGCHTGSSCLRIFDRTHKDGGLSLRMTGLKPDTSYYFSLFIKQLTNRTDGAPYSRIRTIGREVLKSGTVVGFNLGRLTYTRADDMWAQLGGDFHTSDEESSYHDFWVRGEPEDIEYCVDSAALTVIQPYRNFARDTDRKIDALRKTDITVVGDIPEGTFVTVRLENHEFGFGTAINGKPFIGSSDANKAYREFILEHFNWAVFENDMKWKPMEKREGAVNFGTVDKAIGILQDHNKTIRGHAISWDMKDANPNWLTKKDGAQLKEELLRRLKYVVDHYKNNIKEWDVCNEYIHNHFFEANTGLLELIEEEFRQVKKIDPNADLYLNDYQVVRDGQFTSAQANLARYLLARNTPVEGIGIQSHLRSLPIRPEVLAKRVQIAGTPGLPITITEFSAHSKDIDVRAEGVETALRVYFADPQVHAIVLWGYGTEYTGFADDFYLFEGQENKPNAAGEKMLALFKKWNTYKRIRVENKTVNTSFRGFYGDYSVTVTKGKTVISKQFFKAAKKGSNVFQL